ncbi:unnamed protein product [Orchesella dallaii]|uniref:Uncharacterized protein n=1 Tax=Orchesella dallaii TaxID=48710 RepID=A0ABP1RAB1_9HEXA
MLFARKIFPGHRRSVITQSQSQLNKIHKLKLKKPEAEAESGNMEEELMQALELNASEIRKLLDFEKDETPLKVIVKKPATKVQYVVRAPIYNLPPSSVGLKGYALILNIIEFEDYTMSRGRGATLDMEYMRELWKQLGYQIFPSEEDLKKKRMTKDDILRMIKEFKESCEKGKPKSIVVYIGSHGGWDTICTSDADKEGNEITIKLYNEIIDEFSNAKFKNQRKILPKIFLIQACQDHSRNSRDNSKPHPPGHIDDTVVCTAQVPGASANRDYHKGSWFVYCLTWVFMNKAHKCTLDEMLTMVTITIMLHHK